MFQKDGAPHLSLVEPWTNKLLLMQLDVLPRREVCCGFVYYLKFAIVYNKEVRSPKRTRMEMGYVSRHWLVLNNWLIILVSHSLPHSTSG